MNHFNSVEMKYKINIKYSYQNQARQTKTTNKRRNNKFMKIKHPSIIYKIIQTMV